MQKTSRGCRVSTTYCSLKATNVISEPVICRFNYEMALGDNVIARCDTGNYIATLTTLRYFSSPEKKHDWLYYSKPVKTSQN